jgi:hypothetical protein
MKINVCVPQDVAIKNGLHTHGMGEVVIASWEGWSDEERAVLAQLVQPDSVGEIVLRGAKVYAKKDRVHGTCPIVEDFAVEALRKVVSDVIVSVEEKLDEKAEEQRRHDELVASLPQLARERITKGEVDWLCKYGDKLVACKAHDTTFEYSQRVPLEKLYWLEWARLVSATSDSDNAAQCVMPDDIKKIAWQTAERTTTKARDDAERRAREYATKYAQDEAKKRQKAENLAAKNVEERSIFGEHANKEQLARDAAGYLPNSERAGVVRDWIFSVLDDMTRYERLPDSAVEHEKECYNPWEGKGTRVSWGVEDLEQLTAEQFIPLAKASTVLKAFVEERPGWSFKITPRRHTGICETCEGTKHAYSLLVEVTTAAGNMYSRAFALPDAK